MYELEKSYLFASQSLLLASCISACSSTFLNITTDVHMRLATNADAVPNVHRIAHKQTKSPILIALGLPTILLGVV